ncbi:hypothetical protein [Streptosporangium sp. NPDC002721]
MLRVGVARQVALVDGAPETFLDLRLAASRHWTSASCTARLSSFDGSAP